MFNIIVDFSFKACIVSFIELLADLSISFCRALEPVFYSPVHYGDSKETLYFTSAAFTVFHFFVAIARSRVLKDFAQILILSKSGLNPASKQARSLLSNAVNIEKRLEAGELEREEVDTAGG
ncbi:hypothetical protein IEQ34_013814 [Dendrobium chrysotoxum]|uniref:Uncharacterized protein n=1 Tax=Dendrobium chrysotoxum TaxID=161865 RepID=A0AAV7GS14_DENCH|nr:hypothetical protein IEQ34_013814 [Dendrobium chrysotoxum]